MFNEIKVNEQKLCFLLMNLGPTLVLAFAMVQTQSTVATVQKRFANALHAPVVFCWKWSYHQCNTKHRASQRGLGPSLSETRQTHFQGQMEETSNGKVDPSHHDQLPKMRFTLDLSQVMGVGHS